MIVVDTSVWINHWRDQLTPSVASLRGAVDPNAIVTLDLVLLEALQGARSDAEARRIDAVLSAYPLLPCLSPDLARRCAAHYRSLRTAGLTPRRTTDMMIATWCVANDAALLQDDRDYELIAPHLGLRLA
jgi:predicted nucleic acid-binding protein